MCEHLRNLTRWNVDSKRSAVIRSSVPLAILVDLETARHPRGLAVARIIAASAGRTCRATATGVRAFPRPHDVLLAHPACAVAPSALRRRLGRLGIAAPRAFIALLGRRTCCDHAHMAFRAFGPREWRKVVRVSHPDVYAYPSRWFQSLALHISTIRSASNVVAEPKPPPRIRSEPQRSLGHVVVIVHSRHRPDSP
jgi:hypothetical protein